VKRGTLLFKIDPAPYEATLNKLKGTLAQEEAQFEKAKRDQARLKPSSARKIGGNLNLYKALGGGGVP
jgi:membrane fusion protein, multidrug efflux system